MGNRSIVSPSDASLSNQLPMEPRPKTEPRLRLETMHLAALA